MTDVSIILRPPCLCPFKGTRDKHGNSIQSSINLDDTFLQITHEWKTAETVFLTRLFTYLSSIVSRILGLIHWMVTIFNLITWLVKRENIFFDKHIERFLPRTAKTLKFKMCRFLDEASYWAEKLLKYTILPALSCLMNLINFGGFLVLDFRKWWRHVQPKNTAHL